jgi:diguanylate cyclase (GGDEF)-like protein/PAS domain S-box-containing protein
MTLQWTVGGCVLLFSAGLSAAVLALLWGGRTLPKVRAFWPVIALALLWSLVTALEAMTAETFAKILLSKLEHVCVNLIGPLFVLFAFRFAGRSGVLRSYGARALFWILPIVNVLFAATNEWHGLLWSGFSPGAEGSLILMYHHGPWYYVVVATSYAYLAAAAYILIRVARANWTDRRQVRVVVAALLIPWIANVIYILQWAPIGVLGNITPLSFAVSMAILAWSILPSRPLSLLPVASSVLLETLPDGVLVLDAKGHLLSANPAALAMLGLTDEHIGQPACDAIAHWPDFAIPQELETPENVEVTIRNGTSRTLGITTTPILRHHRLKGRVVVLHDVTPRVRMESELRRSEERYRHLVDNALVGVYVSTMEGQILYANEVMWRLFGYSSADEFASTKAEAMYRRPADRQALVHLLVEAGHVTDYEAEIVTKQGAYRTVSLSASLAGHIISGMLLDITEQRDASVRLQESEERFRNLFERMADAVFITDYEGRILQANQAAGKQTGYGQDELLRLNIVQDLSAAALPMRMEAHNATLHRGDTVRFEEQKRRKDGEVYWTECALSPVEVRGERLILSINRDITARKRAEEQLQYLSTHDPLTGAYNRRYFNEEMARLARSRRFPVSILVADVNGLKKANDEEGHAAGDQVLRCTCDVMQSAVRDEDILARIGGDEFAVLLPTTDEQAAHGVLARIQAEIVAHNRKPSPHRPVSVALGAATAEPSESLEHAMHLADARMYENKTASRHQ